MSTGRFAQRGWAFQSFAFRTWGLAGATGDVEPQVAAGSIVAEFRSRTTTAANRERLAVAEFRSRTAVARGRQ